MRWGVRTLDVNEQNPLAAGFYERAGFVVVGRSPVDGAGRPFPLLHMRLRLAGEAGVPGTAGGSTRSPASPPAQGAGLPGSPVPSRKAAARAASASAGGAWFDSADPALMRDHIRACEVMARFNAQQGMLDADRMKMLHGFLGAVGEGSSLSTGAQVDYGYNLFLGRNCFFNFNCTFLDGAPITFGDDVGVGPGCSFVTPLHPLLARERARCEDAGGTGHVWERSLPITVESGVWIAANVTVNAACVPIGEGAVIGPGSVVTRDIPPRTLAYGNPCPPRARDHRSRQRRRCPRRSRPGLKRCRQGGAVAGTNAEPPLSARFSPDYCVLGQACASLGETVGPSSSCSWPAFPLFASFGLGREAVRGRMCVQHSGK